MVGRSQATLGFWEGDVTGGVRMEDLSFRVPNRENIDKKVGTTPENTP